MLTVNEKPLPPGFLERMQVLLEGDFSAFLACYEKPAVAALRVNTLKISAREYLKISPFMLEAIPWCPAGFQINSTEDEVRPGKHPHHAAGLFYLQEPSAMVVTEILDPQPGERILDLAAAPGGKTTHILARMQDRGLLVANDIRTKRIPALISNLERWGARSTVILNESPERLADHLPGFFDRVLVDAPCSGEGMFRREPGARLEWSEAAIPGYAARQRLILDFAARLVRPGGMLVYSTCTFNQDENERVIVDFLKVHDEYEPGCIPAEIGVSQGFGTADMDQILPSGCCVRIWPHLAPGEGHFAANLRHKGTGSPSRPGAGGQAAVPDQARHYLQSFCEDHLQLDVSQMNLALHGSHIYRTPDGLPDLSNLRVVRAGWWLGEIKKDRFEPAHALAMAMPAEQAITRMDLISSDRQVLFYMGGHPLEVNLPDGWTMVTVDGFPLGWGKAVKGVLKNHYPAGLRQV